MPVPRPVLCELISSSVYMLRVELEVVVLMEHEFAKCAALEDAQHWG